MSTINPSSKPEESGPEQVGLIRDHLRDVLASPAFAGSKRAQEFLQLIVEHALAGRFDSLRERMIGAEMFGRSIDYDTANDAVVRVKATEVRRKLAQYYQESAKIPRVRILLQPGSYIPLFRWDAPEKVFEPLKETEAAATELPQTQVSGGDETLVAAGQGAGRTPPVMIGLLAGLLLLAGIVYVGFKAWPKRALPKTEFHTLAILPLQNLSGDPRQEYFADGMTEELIADLGQLSALRVISRTSAMTYKGTTKTLPEIARELSVDAVVEGSVLREGNEVRITAQLIDAKTDQHLWARSYVRDLTSVLALQGEVAKSIADEISIEVTPQEQARLIRPRPVNPEAQDLYLQGLHMLNSGDPRRSLGYFESAIEKDSNYASAYAALAGAYGWLGEAGWLPYQEAFPKQFAAAQKAVELDDSLSEGHAALANAALSMNWDWGMCERELNRALELNPNSGFARLTQSYYLLRIGRLQEAIGEAKRDIELDPVSSRSYMNAAFAYYFSRQYDEALAQIQRASALGPNREEVIFPLAVIYAEKGMYEKAIGEFQKLGDQPHALGHLGNVYARAGRVPEARATISKLLEHVRKNGLGRYEIALVYAGMGERDDAFAWLENALAAHDKGVTYMKIDPCLDPLRSDARFQDLIRRVGLPL